MVSMMQVEKTFFDLAEACQAWLPDGYCKLFRSYVFGPLGSAKLRCKTPSTLAQPKERKGSYFAIWQSCCQDRNVLVICDRGTMDASAFISRDQWNSIVSRTGLDEVEIRDNRYNQVWEHHLAFTSCSTHQI